MSQGRCNLIMVLVLAGCPAPTTDAPLDDVEDIDGPVYPLTDTPYTALQNQWAPRVPSQEVKDQIAIGELSVYDHDAFDGAGLGVEWVDGHDWQEHLELAPEFTEGADRRSVAWFWQVADPQLIDEESPIRFEAFEALYRPQGHITAQVLEAHVRTARRFADLAERPFDFALLAGDLTDGSHRNELQWVLTALNGGVIDPDSGADDDPVEGPGNDYNDPFRSDGIGAPWYAALGNHETQYNGGFDLLTEEIRAAAQGTEIYEHPLFATGFRDGSTLNADLVTEGSTVADLDRLPLNLIESIDALYTADGDPPGHGLTLADVSASRAYFSAHPIEGVPLRLIVLNTVNTFGGIGVGQSGVIDTEQFVWLEDELALADDADELVVVMSHHKAENILVTSPVPGADLEAALSASEGVILHLTGHGHRNEKRELEGPEPSVHHGYWELMLASTVDFPMHSRIYEIVDEGNGFVSVYCTNFDHNSPEGSLAHRSRELAGAKEAFGTVLSTSDVAADWEQDLSSQNLLLRIEIPTAVRDNLASFGDQTLSSAVLEAL